MKSKISIVVMAAALAVAGCSEKRDRGASGQAEPSKAASSGGEGAVIRIDGSSTVYPISQAVAEEFQGTHGGRVTIGVSGTGGGFKKFCRGETDITGASRPIKPTERDACAEAGIEFIELPAAYDGLAVVVHKNNDWVDHMTVAELETMWEPEAVGKGVKRWSQIRTGWPDRQFNLFGAGVDSGTYDYFTAAIVGREHASRGDFTASEDDNVLVQGVATDPVALGFFGFAYYQENADKLKLVAIDDEDPSNGDGPIAPDLDTVANGTYQPLSRPIFIYVNKKTVERPEVEKFVQFFLEEGRSLVKEVGYIPLPDGAYELARRRFEARTVGSLFEGGSKVGVTIEEILRGGV
jgi:phosphate transport system substrate-binding protein